MSTSTAQPADLQERTRITVSLERNPYDVIIGRSMVSSIGAALAELSIRSGTKILVVSNPDVAGPYGESCLKGLKAAGFKPVLLEIDAGEERKNLHTLSLILDKAQQEGLERTSLMLALGGGVVESVSCIAIGSVAS